MIDLRQLAELHRQGFSNLRFDCGIEADPGVLDAEEWRDWTDRKTSPDQLRIEDYLGGFRLSGERILHIGVGNSGLAKRFAGRAKEIFGTTVVEAEADHGNSLALPSYRVVVHNKYSGADANVPVGFDFIVDNNPTSFCCCFRHLATAVEFYASRLAVGGQLLCDRAGLSWTPVTNPAWGFGVDDFAQVAALAGLSCYRINADTHAFARQAPVKPPLPWRAAIGLRKLGGRSVRRFQALKRS